MIRLAKILIAASFMVVVLGVAAIYLYTEGFLSGQSAMAATWINGCLQGDVTLNVSGIVVHCGPVSAL